MKVQEEQKPDLTCNFFLQCLQNLNKANESCRKFLPWQGNPNCCVWAPVRDAQGLALNWGSLQGGILQTCTHAVVGFCHIFYPFYPQKKPMFGFCFSCYIPSIILGGRQTAAFVASLIFWFIQCPVPPLWHHAGFNWQVPPAPIQSISQIPRVWVGPFTWWLLVLS